MRGEKLELALVGFTVGGFVLTVVVVLLLVTRLPLVERGGAGAAPGAVRVSVDAAGVLSVEGTEVEAASLAPTLAVALRSRPGAPLVIDVAPGAPVGRLELVSRAVDVATRPRVRGPASEAAPGGGALAPGPEAAAPRPPEPLPAGPADAGPEAAPPVAPAPVPVPKSP